MSTWARAPQADQLLDLLRCCEADTVYLVGDIVDFWRVRRGPYWPQSHNDVLQKLMRKVRKDARLVLIPGNHDEGLRDYEEAVAAEARRRKADGIVCGHIHHAADRTFEGIHYLNCGDWVESCTAVAESHTGELYVIRWADPRMSREQACNGAPALPPAVQPPAGPDAHAASGLQQPLAATSPSRTLAPV